MSVDNISFDIAPEVTGYGVNGIYLIISGLRNSDIDSQFEQYRDETINRLLEKLTPEAIAQDPFLKGYRDLHSMVGFSNRNFPAAPETLLENLVRYRKMAHVNLLVDIYNLVSVQTHLAFGAHDLARITGDIHLRPMQGDEGYWPLGSPEPKKARPGGYSYIDDADDIICMLDSRQVEKTKVIKETRDCFYIIQGNAIIPFESLQKGAELLISLTKKYCGGEPRVLYPADYVI
jgi:DNA/RNA-binding domain of Phe-tRNA-synthetase-like protein